MVLIATVVISAMKDIYCVQLSNNKLLEEQKPHLRSKDTHQVADTRKSRSTYSECESGQ